MRAKPSLSSLERPHLAVCRYSRLGGIALVTLSIGSLLSLPGASGIEDRGDKGPVTIQQTDQELRVFVDGKAFFTYRYDTSDPDLPRPVIHPLHGPTGAVLTQMGEVPDKREKHFHHTGLWIAHQNFTGGNNWQMDADPKKKPAKYSRLLHRKFQKAGGGNPAQFIEYLEWDSTDGKTILVKELRTVTIPHRPADRRVIDFDLNLEAKGNPVTLNPTPYHLLAVRAIDSMVPAFSKEAVITNSEGQKNPKDGTPAKWIDVTGPVGGKMVGISLFNHPGNFRHPTPCLNFVNQTIGLSPTHKEAYTLAPGKGLNLRIRVLVHAGTVAEAGVAQEYEIYCKEVK
jgi:hypothetical protein